ncbi:unnamed protein product, partial [marine sediment metagenome]
MNSGEENQEKKDKLVIEEAKIGKENVPNLVVEVISNFGDKLPAVAALAKALGFLHRGFSTRSLVEYLKYLEVHAIGNRELIRKLEIRTDLVEEIFSKEILASYVLQGARKALNETRKEKLERFAAVAANCIFKYHDIEPDTKIESFNLCEELTERDIAVLRVLGTKDRMSVKEALRELLDNSEQEYEKLSYFNMSLSKLRARGLIMESEERVMIIQDTMGPAGPESGY